MDATKLITLGAVAVGGYFLYENFFATAALPSDAEYGGQIPVGADVNIPASGANTSALQTGATATTAVGYLYYSPSTKLFYSSYTAPTAAQTAASQSATTTSSAASTSTSTPATTTAATTTAAATPINYAAMCTATRTAVQQSGDTNFTASGGDYLGTPYQWQFYWNLQSGAPALNINGMFTDTTSPISGAAFCAAVTTYLAAQGLSGFLAGMGFYGMGDDSADDLTGLDTSSLNPVGVGPTLGGGSTVYSTQGTLPTTSNYTPIYIALAAAGAVLLFAGGGRR